MRRSVAAATAVTTMLEELRISSLGVIDSSTLELGPGLTVITGETGAGKTMVVTAVGLLLAVRAVFSMASRFLLGRMSAALGRTRLMVTSILLAAVSLAVVAVPMPTWALVVVLAAIRGDPLLGTSRIRLHAELPDGVTGLGFNGPKFGRQILIRFLSLLH